MVQKALDQADACYNKYSNAEQWVRLFEATLDAQLKYEDLLLKEQMITFSSMLQELKTILVDIQNKQK